MRNNRRKTRAKEVEILNKKSFTEGRALTVRAIIVPANTGGLK